MVNFLALDLFSANVPTQTIYVKFFRYGIGSMTTVRSGANVTHEKNSSHSFHYLAL